MNRGWWRCSIRGRMSIAGLRVGVILVLRGVVWLGAWLWVLRVIRRRLLWVLRVISWLRVSWLRVSWFMSRLMLGWRWWGSIGIVRLRFRIGFRVLLGVGLVDRLLVFRLRVGL